MELEKVQNDIYNIKVKTLLKEIVYKLGKKLNKNL